MSLDTETLSTFSGADLVSRVADHLGHLPKSQRAACLDTIIRNLHRHSRATMELKYAWPLHARDSQLPPPGDWDTWLILAGRGFGKTRTGAEWVRAQSLPRTPIRGRRPPRNPHRPRRPNPARSTVHHDRGRVRHFEHIPAMSTKPTSSETGIVVVGADMRRQHAYVLADESARLTPNSWALRVIHLYDKFGATMIVVEDNAGGQMAESTIQNAVERTLPIKRVRARQGKYVRAEPVAALYEQSLPRTPIRGTRPPRRSLPRPRRPDVYLERRPRPLPLSRPRRRPGPRRHRPNPRPQPNHDLVNPTPYPLHPKPYSYQTDTDSSLFQALDVRNAPA